jgi:hypothetical protein
MGQEPRPKEPCDLMMSKLERRLNSPTKLFNKALTWVGMVLQQRLNTRDASRLHSGVEWQGPMRQILADHPTGCVPQDFKGSILPFFYRWFHCLGQFKVCIDQESPRDALGNKE